MGKSSNLKFEIGNYKRVLLVRLDRVGDVVLSTPVIKAVRDALPESYIAFMACPHAREILEGNPYLNEVIIYDKEGVHRSILGNLKFISELRGKRFDIAMILHPTARTHIITALAAIPERIGYDKKCGALLTKRIPHTKQFGLKHEIDYNLGLLQYIGIELGGEKTLYMPVRDESEKKVEEIFVKNGIKDSDRVVVVNPGASCPSKRWGSAAFARVCDRLVEKRGAKVVVIAGPSDKAFGDEVASSMTAPCVNLSGETSVGDVASVLRRSRLFISNDSGPVHISCAVGTPVIVIFGRRDRGLSPVRWGPSGGKDVYIHKDVGCEVCLAHDCGLGFKCLEAITVDEVASAAEKLLGE